MSLKAKLEAVIYAAEEPVTLNQLAALFAADALEWKAQQEAAAAEQTADVAGVSPEALPLIEKFVDAPATADTSVPAQPAVDEAPASASNEGGEPTSDTSTEAGGKREPEAPPANEVVSISETEAYPPIVVEGEPAPPPSDPAAAAAPIDPIDAETEIRRLARQKDREVKSVLKQLLDELIAGYQADGRGVEIREIAGGYRMATKPECHDAVRMFVKSLKPALKLSLPALETLAVIAYKQPVTAPEVNEIRGVESAGVLGSLLARKLIATAGRKPVIGRPILYKTTKEFLLRFGLKDVSELPSMEEFEKMAASELEMEPEATEADRAADAAEGAEAGEPAAADALEENAGAELESNSPSGEEMAGTADSAQEQPESAQESLAPPESGGAAPRHSTETQTVEATVESGAEQETEATPNAKASDH
jgi:segregation and condensation protein B